jgi:hypothetical protein
MKWHSPHKKKNNKNKSNMLSYKKKTRSQRKRKIYMNKPKSKRKKDEIKVAPFVNRKIKTIID